MTDNKKIIVLITMYRIPQSIKEGVYNALTWHNRMEGKVKNTNKYRKQILDQIITYLKVNSQINHIIIASNLN